MVIPKWDVRTWLYYLLVVGAGWLVIGSCLLSGLALRTPDATWLFLVVPLLLLCNSFIQIPNMDARICPAGVFVLYAAVGWGPAPAALLAAVEALLNSYQQTTDRVRRVIFNTAALSLAIYLSTHFAMQFMPAGAAESEAAPLLRALLVALAYYLLSTGMMLGIMGLTGDKPALRAARSAFLWTWVDYAVGGLVAGLLGLLVGNIAFALVLCVAFLKLTHVVLRHYFGMLRDRDELLVELRATHLASLETWATAIEAKDPVAHGHVVRVSALSARLGCAVGMDAGQLDSLRIAALLHDIGKLAIPEHLLYQNDQPSPEDQRKLESHALLGAEILEQSRLEGDIKGWVKHHHERYDGRGYPYGLAGEEIPLGARVLAVVDTYDKIRNPRSGEEVSAEDALEALYAEAGTALDPQLVDLLCAQKELLDASQSSAAADNDAAPGAVTTSLSQASFVKNVAMSHKEARVLYTLNRNLRGTQELELVLELVLDAISEFVPFVSSTVLLPGGDDEALEVVRSTGCGLVEEEKWPNSLWLARVAEPAAKGGGLIELVRCNCACKAPDAIESEMRVCTRAVFDLAPSGKERGLLVLYSNPPLEYTEEHRRIIHSFIEHSAPSIANAREYHQFQRDSLTDGLTELWNQRALQQKGSNIVASSIEQKRSGCVVMIDLNGFKEVNDTLGHHKGDQLLVAVANEMRAHVRSSDFVARIGGDEFVIILINIPPPALARRLESLYHSTCALWPSSAAPGRRGISYGCVWFPEEGTVLEDLLVKADGRMYEDKMIKKQGNVRRLRPAAAG